MTGRSASMVGRRALRAVLGVALAATVALAAAADRGDSGPPGLSSSARPSGAWTKVGFDQRIGAALPLDATFADDDGRPITLAEALGGRPAVLVMNYYDCPNLCSVVLDGTFEALAKVGLDAGRDYDVVAVGIDPREGPDLARAKKVALLRRFARPADQRGVHFLTGREPAIARVADAVGFRYAWDPQLAQYAHAAGVVVVTPDGRVARYLFGARFPTIAMRLAVVEASEGRLGTLADQVWLLCYHYDPKQGRYGVAIVRTLQVAGVLCALAIAVGIGGALRHERRRRATSGDPRAAALGPAAKR